MSVIEIIFLVSIILLVIWLKWFAEGWIESQQWHKDKKKEGQAYWEWVTSKPYITPKKITYWLFIIAILSIYMYLGFNMPI